MRAFRLIAVVVGLLVASAGSAHVMAAPGKAPITVVLSGLGCTTALGADTFAAQSWQWGASNPVISGGGSGQGQGRATVSELVLSRAADACSPALLGGVLGAKHFAALTLSQYDVAGVLKATVVLTEVFVTGWSISGSSASPDAGESVSLAFERFTFTDVASGNKVTYDSKAP